MLLTIDVGNTNMVFTVFDGETRRGGFRLKTDGNRTADEIGLLVWSYFQRFGLAAEEVEDVVIASVVPPVMHALKTAMERYFGRTPLVVDEDLDPGLPYGVPGDERLGPDRSVACVGALARYGGPLIVLDFGTATTLDAVDRQGRYRGGCIAAGVRISMDALFQKTAMLPNVALCPPERVLGATAVEHIQAGCVLGYIGAMEHLVRLARAELGEEGIRVVATGGLSGMVARHSDIIDVVDDDLVSEGLRVIYRRRQAEG